MKTKNSKLIKSIYNKMYFDSAYSLTMLYKEYSLLHEKYSVTEDKYSMDSFRRAISRMCTNSEVLRRCFQGYYYKPLHESKLYHDTISADKGLYLSESASERDYNNEVLRLNHESHLRLSVINCYLQDSYRLDRIGFFSGTTVWELINHEVDVQTFLNLETIELTSNNFTTWGQRQGKRIQTKRLSFNSDNACSSFSDSQFSSSIKLIIRKPRINPETQKPVVINRVNHLTLQILEMISSLSVKELQEESCVDKLNDYIKNSKGYKDFSIVLPLFPQMTIDKIRRFGINIPTLSD